MVSADVLQARRPLSLELVKPAGFAVIDERLFSVLETIERELDDVRNRLVSFDRRLKTLQTSVAEQAALADGQPVDGEFFLHVSSRDGYEVETRTGLLPEPGDLVDDAREVIVLSVGGSPLPNDARPCVYALVL